MSYLNTCSKLPNLSFLFVCCKISLQEGIALLNRTLNAIELTPGQPVCALVQGVLGTAGPLGWQFPAPGKESVALRCSAVSSKSLDVGPRSLYFSKISRVTVMAFRIGKHALGPAFTLVVYTLSLPGANLGARDVQGVRTHLLFLTFHVFD